MVKPPWQVNKKTAYTSVPSRTTLSSSNLAGSSSNSSSSSSTDTQFQWPESLKSFVSRCLSQITESNKHKLEAQLKEKISNAFAQKQTFLIDWDHESLPILEKTSRKKNESSRGIKRQKTVVLDEAGEPISSAKQIKHRQKRFEREHQAELRDSTPIVETNPALPDGPVIGVCTVLEKKYLRLTSAPDPLNVRPEHILKQTLTLLKEKWKTEQNYPYICDQFKSLRQDLTVQHIENEFTVQVYEIHARIALEKQDLGEYNQCQSRLKELYSIGIKGCEEEFLAYRILYLLHTQARPELGQMLLELTPTQITSPYIIHALQTNEAIMTNNYSWLFKLYVTAPNMGGYVMDNFAGRMRLQACAYISKAFRPNVPIKFICDQLSFENNEETVIFLNSCGVGQNIVEDGEHNETVLKTKESYAELETRRQQAFKKVDIKGQV